MTYKGKKESFRSGAVASYAPSFHVDADWRGVSASVTLGGILGIGEYSPEQILLLGARERITLGGSNMHIAVLERGSLIVSGEVESITVSRGKGRR
ncbi:MAG: hypothetical protein E7617_07365 [Ruminococcaceae bacterium]|nr:hypothetical protein [Oscillospiraceae bacterium]